MKYVVNIEELLSRDIVIEADNEEQAELKVKQLYCKGKIVLDYGDFIGKPMIKCKHSCDETIKCINLDQGEF